jgi:outer membrane protein insertion porin family
MRVDSAAVLTLATLAASNVTHQANALPNQTTNLEAQTETATDVVVVPFIETQPAQTEVVTSPETTYAVEFSSQSVVILNNVKNINKNLITDNDLVVIATSLEIVGANPELEQVIRKVIKTQTGAETSQTDLQKDVAAILDTGLFASANVNTISTSSDLSITYQLQPVFVQAIQLSGAKILTYQVALKNFKNQIGKDISPAALQQIVQKINQWYTENGYTLARQGTINSTKPPRYSHSECS